MAKAKQRIYRVAKRFTFSAAHHNPNDSGQCQNLHGHNWEVEFIFKGHELDSRGWLVGFGEIKDWLKPYVDDLDHSDLNKKLNFNPTCENIAEHFYSLALGFAHTCNAVPVSVAEVKVTERAGEWSSFASYSEESHY
jgi:6-pyruvoyltetrahydropterin/6-carboxytetrahydropterin synthase